MNSASPSTFDYAWAARLGCALLVVLTAVSVFTFLGRTHRLQLEHVEEPTAVGDLHLVPAAEPNTSLGTFQGQPLTVSETVKERDSSMRKAGLDDSQSFTVYRSSDPNEIGALFLKVAEGSYLKIAPPH